MDRPPTISSFVLETIRDQILRGKYPPGSRLDQRQLATEMGVSLIPIRESLRQLEAEGFVRILPRRGAFVADLSVDELKEIYLIREDLEARAAELAIPNLSSPALEKLNQLIREMERATRIGDSETLFDLNRDLHFTIYRAAQRPLLLQLITSLWDRSVRYRRLYTALRERQGVALTEHIAIWKACQAGDANAAARAIRVNVRQTTEGILAKIASEHSSAEEGDHHDSQG